MPLITSVKSGNGSATSVSKIECGQFAVFTVYFIRAMTIEHVRNITYNALRCTVFNCLMKCTFISVRFTGVK